MRTSAPPKAGIVVAVPNGIIPDDPVSCPPFVLAPVPRPSTASVGSCAAKPSGSDVSGDGLTLEIRSPCGPDIGLAPLGKDSAVELWDAGRSGRSGALTMGVMPGRGLASVEASLPDMLSGALPDGESEGCAILSQTKAKNVGDGDCFGPSSPASSDSARVFRPTERSSDCGWAPASRFVDATALSGGAASSALAISTGFAAAGDTAGDSPTGACPPRRM